MNFKHNIILLISIIIISCSKDDNPTSSQENLNISPSSNADAGSSYMNSKTDIHVENFGLPSGANSGSLRDAISYLDANGDGFTDVFKIKFLFSQH